MTVLIRSAVRADVPTILGFIRELAVFEKLEHEVVATEPLLADNLFGPKAYAECLIAELDAKPVGFALFFHNFSTFLGKPGLYVEDVYVTPDCRGAGIGKLFFQRLAQIAEERDCGRMEWWVLDWNKPALEFYEKMGARPMSEWTVQRLTRAEINALATQPLSKTRQAS